MTVKIIHKNSRVEFKNSTADQLEYGELALNYNESGPYLQCKGSDDEVVQLGGVFISATAPGNPLPGKWWLNGTTLNVYDGTQWIAIAGGGGGGGGSSDPVYNGKLTLEDEDGNTLGTFTANQATNNTITIPTSDFSGSWDDLTDKPIIGNGKITIEESNGNDIAEFTVNQAGNLIITLPAGASFSGSYDDLTDKPTIGDGSIEINGGAGITASGDNATANQVAGTSRSLAVKAGAGLDFDGDGNVIIDPNFSLDGNITAPGDGLITVKTEGGDTLGTFTVNQAGPTDITIPAVELPDSLHPKGFIDVSLPAPASPEHGDIYIQHRNDLATATADASFTGIAGDSVEDGTFVMFGVDDLWHAGGSVTPDPAQDGKTTLTNTHNTDVVLEFSANQATSQVVAMPFMPLDIRELQELS